MGPSAVARYGKDHYRITAWALDCAERVLPIFEAHRPGDFRPRRAVDIGRAWLRGEISMIDARSFAFPAHAAARDATDPAVVAAARAAGQALGVAHVVGHAPHAAAYALRAIDHSGGDVVTEWDWQQRNCPRRLHPIAFPDTARVF